MSQPRAERLMNLHIMLLGARRFATKDAIRRACYPDHPYTEAGNEAFERAFERDKDSLRALGAYIEVGSSDPLFDDEVGYRIPTEQTSLPELRFEADEAAALGIAAQVWEQATLARATTRALAKLKADGVDIDPSRLDVLAPAIRADEPAFEPLWDAIEKRRVVTFDYQRTTETAPTAAASSRGAWSARPAAGTSWATTWTGSEERVFRLTRIQGPVKATGRPGAYDVPAGTDVRAVAARLAPASPSVRAELLVRGGPPPTCAGAPSRSTPTTTSGTVSWSRPPSTPSPTRCSGTATTSSYSLRSRCASVCCPGCARCWGRPRERAYDVLRHRPGPGRPPAGPGALSPGAG